MRRFLRADLEHVLRQIDARLAAPCSVIVIGGTVSSLSWRPQHATTDLDVWSADSAFWDACRALAASNALSVPVQAVSIAEPPQEFEGRVEPVSIPDLRYLHVLVPERHDWAMMKVARGVESDFQAIEALHASSPLQLETLSSRYRETLVMGPRRRFRLKFLDLVSRLFGDDVAGDVDASLDPEDE